MSAAIEDSVEFAKQACSAIIEHVGRTSDPSVVFLVRRAKNGGLNLESFPEQLELEPAVLERLSLWDAEGYFEVGPVACVFRRDDRGQLSTIFVEPGENPFASLEETDALIEQESEGQCDDE